MKSILVILLVAISLGCNAQTFTDNQDDAYQLLDKERITTGVLANRAFPWVDLTIPQTSEDTLSYGYLVQAWQQLYLAAYDRDNIRDIDDDNHAMS